MKTTMTMEELMDQFISEQDVAPKSKRHYQMVLFQFFVNCNNHGQKWDLLTPANFVAYKQRLMADKKSTLTINLYLTVVKKFYRWCELRNYYHDITLGIKGVRNEIGFRKRPLTDVEVVRLLDKIDRTKLDGKRDAAMISLMIHSGLRCCEVLRGLVDDIRWRNGQYYFNVLGKGKHDKVYQPITEMTYNLIMEYLEARGYASGSEALFMSHRVKRFQPLTSIGLSWIITNRFNDAGIVDRLVTPHSFRHTYAINLLRCGKQIEDVQTLMRHSNISTTMIYLKYYQTVLKDNSDVCRKLDDLYEWGGTAKKRSGLKQAEKHPDPTEKHEIVAGH